MKRLCYAGIILVMVLLPGCLTIFEKYTINKDGSGSMEYIIDMSELYSLLESFSDSTAEEEVEFEQSFQDVIPKLEAIDGISNVRLTGDRNNYVFGIMYEFKDADVLNRALAILLEEEEDEDIRFVDISRKRFIRYHKTADEISMDSLLGEGKELDENMLTGILDEMNYNISVRFQKKIKKVDTRAEYIQDDPKSVVIEANFNELINDPEILKTSIKTR